MRILLAAAGSHGDVLPFVALGREFAARGHEPILYANPFFRRLADEAGIHFVAVSSEDDYWRLFRETSTTNAKQAFRRVTDELGALCPAYCDAMRADVLPGDTIAVGASMLFAARLLGEACGVPCATVHLAPTVIYSDLAPPRLAPRWLTPTSPAWLKRLAWWALDTFYYRALDDAFNAVRARWALPPVKHLMRDWLHRADCTVCLFPDWFAPPAADWPPGLVQCGFPLYDHDTAQTLPPALEAFLSAGPPPVAFSAGTATASAHGFFRTSVAACKRAGVRGILLTHVPDLVPPDLPPEILHVPYAPFSRLLPRLAAFVHHGGIGTTSQALRAGVPQLIRPVAYDQFDNSARAQALGVAHELLPAQYTTRRVAQRLRAMTTDAGLQARCRETAARFDGRDAVATACDTILSRLATPARAR